MQRRFAISFVAKAAILTGLGGLFVACSNKKPDFAAIDITGADYARGFSLADQNGQARSLRDFAGKVVVVFFGYTQCPDACPTTMTELLEVKKALGKDGDRLQALFITIDPERDTPEVLKAYVGNFDPSFLALIPSAEALPALAKDYKVFYKKVPGTTPTSYSMDHTAASFIYDPQGKLRLYTRYGSGAASLAADIRLLLKGA
jgi:protein SCO1/2